MTGSRAEPTGVGTLAGAFDPRRNALWAMRLLLAAVVAVTHALAIGFDHQPAVGRAYYGDLAVDGFFVLSGFLVTRSYLSLDHLPRYLWHRFLRIMPGFWVCLLVTALVVAPLTAVLVGAPAAAVFDGPSSAWTYLASNSPLLMRQFGIDGAYGGESINGSLWTLFYEGICYVLVAGLGVLGWLRRPVVVALLAAGLTTVLTAVALGLLPQPPLVVENIVRLTLLFLIGSAAHLYAHRVPVHVGLALLAAAALTASLLLLPDHRALVGAWAFGYLCVYLMVRLPLRWAPATDVSYGLYMYHWPVLAVLALLGLGAAGEFVFVVLGVGAAAAVALLSWRWVEAPALRRKDAAWVGRLGRRRAPAGSADRTS